MPSEKKIIPYDYRLLKKEKRQDSHLTRVLLLYAQRNTCFFSFFLHSLSDRCQIATGTYKTNASSLLGIFSIRQPIYPSICQPINNELQRRHIDIGRNKAVIRSALAKQFFQLIQIFEVAAIFRKKQCLVEVGPDDCFTPFCSDPPKLAPPWRILIFKNPVTEAKNQLFFYLLQKTLLVNCFQK